MPSIAIRPRGNLGNQMLQYLFALRLKEHLPDLQVMDVNLQPWGIALKRSRPKAFQPSIKLQDPDFEAVVSVLRRHSDADVKLRAVPTQVENLASVSYARSVFPRYEGATYRPSPDEVIINVRAKEILGNCHPDYGPIPINFYKSLVGSLQMKPVFLGQLEEDYYSNALRQNFQNAKFIPSQGVLQDFESIRSAYHLIPAISTFSWLAAWLGTGEVYMPALGGMNPLQRADTWLLPVDQERWRFYKFPVRRWVAHPDQIQDVLSGTCGAEVWSRSMLNAVRKENASKRVAVRMQGARKLEKQLRLQAALKWLGFGVGETI